MITFLKNTYLISADEDKHTKTKSGLFIDTTWDKYKWAVREGIVESVPRIVEANPSGTTKKYNPDIDIRIGDKVHFHHFVVQDDMRIKVGDKSLFKCPRFHMFCVIKKKKIVMLDSWVFVSPILEKEEDIVKTFGTLKLWTKATPGEIHLMGTVSHLSNMAKAQGLSKGDTIMFKKDAEYQMNIEGKEYYRMDLANVIAIVRNEKLYPLRDEIIVQNNSIKEHVRPSGLIIPMKPAREQIEKVEAVGIQDEEKQFKVGSKIMFHHHTGSKVEYNKQKYTILRQLEVIGAMI